MPATRILFPGLLALVLIGVLITVGVLLSVQGRLCLPPFCQPGDGKPASWQRSTLTIATSALLVTGRVPDHVWAGTSDGIWESSNGGATWQTSGLKHVQVLSLAASGRGPTIVAGTADGSIYRNEGTGGWHRAGLRLGSSHSIFSVAISRDGRTVLAGTIGALYRGVRRGDAWTWRATAHTDQSAITSIVWAPWARNLAFASIFGSRPPVIVSRNGGRTWRPDDSGLPRTVPAQALLALDTKPPRIIFSTMGSGVWRWSSRGWHDISAGLPERHAMPLTVLPNQPAVVYAGTMGYGVYVKRGSDSWHRVGHGLNGGAYTALGLVEAARPHPELLVGTIRGVYRYTLPDPQHGKKSHR